MRNDHSGNSIQIRKQSRELTGTFPCSKMKFMVARWEHYPKRDSKSKKLPKIYKVEDTNLTSCGRGVQLRVLPFTNTFAILMENFSAEYTNK